MYFDYLNFNKRAGGLMFRLQEIVATEFELRSVLRAIFRVSNSLGL